MLLLVHLNQTGKKMFYSKGFLFFSAVNYRLLKVSYWLLSTDWSVVGSMSCDLPMVIPSKLFFLYSGDF